MKSAQSNFLPTQNSQRLLATILMVALVVGALSLSATIAHADRSGKKLKHWDLHLSDWPEKPTAAIIVQLDPLPKLFKHYRNQRSTIEIRYPGGRQGSKWAREVQGWLVALGVPTSDILLSVGVDEPDRLRLVVIPRI